MTRSQRLARDNDRPHSPGAELLASCTSLGEALAAAMPPPCPSRAKEKDEDFCARATAVEEWSFGAGSASAPRRFPKFEQSDYKIPGAGALTLTPLRKNSVRSASPVGQISRLPRGRKPSRRTGALTATLESFIPDPILLHPFCLLPFAFLPSASSMTSGPYPPSNEAPIETSRSEFPLR